MASFNDVEWKPEYLPTDDKEKVRLVGIEFEAMIKNKSDMPDDEFMFLNEDWLYENSEEYFHEEDFAEDYPYKDEDEEYYEDDISQYKEDKKREYIAKRLQEKEIVIGGWGYDGGGKEFVTMPDSYTLYEQGGSDRLKDIVEMLNKYTIADCQSGTHIHISKLKTDTPKTWDNMYWFMMCFGAQLQKLFGRVSGWAPIPLPQNYFRNENNRNEIIYEAPQKRPEAPNMFSNKHVMINDKKNRYEFRLAKATNNLEEVLAWVELCNNIVEVCANGYIKDIPFSEVLKGKYIRKYAYKIGNENPLRALSSEERGRRISDIKYIKINTAVTTFQEGEEECA